MNLFQFIRDRYKLTGEIPPAGNNMVGIVNFVIVPDWWLRMFGPCMTQIREPENAIRALRNAPPDDVIMVSEWGPWVFVNDRAELISALVQQFGDPEKVSA